MVAAKGKRTKGRKAPAGGERRKLCLECLVVLAILLIPSTVFYLYVGAFRQPVTNTDQTQVLMVNMDNGTVGRQVEDAIIATGTYKFERANYSYAANAVGDGEQWAAIVIPPGFTQRVEDGGDAQIVLLADDSSSYILIRVLSPTVSEVVSGIDLKVKLDAANQTAAAEDQIAMQQAAAAEQLSLLSNTSGELGTGTSTLSTSLGSGSTGLSDTSASEYGLAGAVQAAAAGAVNLHSGLVALGNGSRSVAAGAGSLDSGTAQLMALNTQLNSVLDAAMANALTSNSPSLAAEIATAEAMSSAEYSGLSQANSGAASLSSGANSLDSGLRAAANATGTLAYTMGQVYPAIMYTANQSALASHSLGYASEETSKASSGAAKISDSLGLVSNESGQLSSAGSQVSSVAASLPGVSLVVDEENKADYGTFFATTFAILGLFVGASSAYLYSALGKLKRPLLFAMLLALVQSVVLAAVYSCMGFPMRGGEGAFILVLFSAAAGFVLLTQAMAAIISPNITHEHLTYISPALSILAVFMISSGGVLWPCFTLQPPFSSFSPYIPFSYAVAGVRATALRGDFPLYDVAMLAAFAAVFLAAAVGTGLLRKAYSGKERRRG